MILSKKKVKELRAYFEQIDHETQFIVQNFPNELRIITDAYQKKYPGRIRAFRTPF